MTHTGPMPESKGTLDAPQKTEYPCRKCGKHEVVCKVWESSDGAYEDYKYECLACGHVWWVDGIDS